MKLRRGRPTKGVDHVDGIDVSRDTKRRLKVILRVISGEVLVKDGASMLGLSTTRVLEPGVTRVDQNVALVHELRQPFEHGIHRAAGGEQEQDATRALQVLDQLFQRLGDVVVAAFRLAAKSLARLRAAIPDGDTKAVIAHVERQVAPHHSQPDHTELGSVTLAHGCSRKGVL